MSVYGKCVKRKETKPSNNLFRIGVRLKRKEI